MRRKKIWVVTLMAFMVLALPALAQKGKKPKKGGGSIPVTVTFRDFHGDNVGIVPVPPDRIMSDCQTGDCPYKGSIGSANGNFRLSLGRTRKNQRAIRELFLDFTQCASPNECNLPQLFFPGVDDFAFVGADGAVNFHTKHSGIDLREMFLGESAGNLTLSVTFDLNNIDQGRWRLDFRPNEDCPESSPSISITRTADDTWVIEAGPTDMACLGQLEGGSAFKFSGRYLMPFKITLVCIDPTQCVAPPPPSP